MAIKDIREFIALLQKEEQLQRIGKEVDWDLEIGAITRRCCEIDGPANLFENIKEYPKGYRLLGGSMANYTRIALAMEMDPNSSQEELVNEFINRSANPIKPILVAKGPCKENIHIGDDVDLFEFPAPMIHGGDGGRYISTWHIIVTRDPDSDWVNWGMYRQMIINRNKMTGIFIRVHHMSGLYYNKYEPRGKPMEFATCIGADPISTIIGACPLPMGVNEADIAGGIRKEPVELVKCETVDLMVPAHSEIVIEGEVLPYEREEEGPFGEYPGYMNTPRRPQPVYRVKAITHRNDPILTASNMGIQDDGNAVSGIMRSAIITSELRNKGIPIRGVANMALEGAAHLIVVSTKTPYAGIPFQIASIIWSHHVGMATPYVIVCNDDVDPTDMKEVIHAFVTKCHPNRGITRIENTLGSPVLPFSNLHDKFYGIGPRCLLDCTWPIDWPDTTPIPIKSSFEVIYPKQIQEKVLKSWTDYGFKV